MAYRVYIPSYRKIETTIYVTFDEDTTFNISKQNHLDEVYDEETKDPSVIDTNVEQHVPNDHDMVEPKKHVDSP